MAQPMAHRLAGRYEVRSLIGRGGMAEVHLARHSPVARRRHQDAATRPGAGLDLPGTVPPRGSVRCVAESPEHRRRIRPPARRSSRTRPAARSRSLHRHGVRRGAHGQGPDLGRTAVPINEAIEIVSGVLSALQYSHANHLVHRDIKPGNIMLTSDGKVKVMDFGIARALTDSQATMTQTNAVVGTAQYLSPRAGPR